MIKALHFLTEHEQREAQELNGKWIAILLKDEKTGDPKILRDGATMLADENLINVQARVGTLFPEISTANKNGKKIRYCYIPHKLDF